MPNEFNLGALGNFDHSEKNSLSGFFSSHDTAMILHQTKSKTKTLQNLAKVMLISKA